jgi:hypothetical protein
MGSLWQLAQTYGSLTSSDSVYTLTLTIHTTSFDLHDHQNSPVEPIVLMINLILIICVLLSCQ